MRKFLIFLEVLLVAAAVLVYVAAKVHFFTAFHNDIPAYLHQHWPFWAAFTAIAIAISGIEAIKRRLEPPAQAIGDKAR